MPEGATIIGRVAVKVIPDTEDFRGDAQEALNVIERELQSIKIQFSADVDQLRDEIKDAIREVEHEVDEIELEVEIEEESKRALQIALMYLTRARTVPIIPKLDKIAAGKVAAGLAALSGIRTVRDLAEDFRDWVGSLDRAIPKIGAMAVGLANVGAAALAGTSNLFAFGSSLATIIPAGLALPGILGGIATGTGALIAVMLDFNKRLPEVGDELHKLQNQMSNRFWSRAEEPIRNFFESLLPQFSAGIRQTSADLGTFFARLSRSATDVFDGELQQMFDDLNRSILIASQYTDNFVGIIEKLGSVGAGNLPRLARWFGDISKQFDGWLDDQGTNGLQSFVDTGIEALKDLGGVIRSTSTLLYGVAKAAEAAGGGSLDSLASVMENASDAVNGKQFQESLTNAFEAAHVAMDELTGRSGKQFESLMIRISDLLTNVLPTAGRTAGKALSAIFGALDQDNVQSSLEGLFTNLETSVENLAPAMDPVADGLAGIVDLIGDVTVNLSRSLGPSLATLGDVVADLSGDLKPLVKQLGDLLVNASEFGGPVLRDMGDQLGTVAGLTADLLAPLNEFLDLIQGAPGWLKSFGSNLVAGAALFYVFNAAVGSATTKVQLFTTAMQTAESRGKFLATAMRGLAGAAGFMALNASAGTTNDTLRGLGGILGGAGIGFSVAGPWGAAVGGLGGLFKGLWDTLTDTGEVMTHQQKPVLDYASALDQISGATTRAARGIAALDLQQSGAFESAQALGISQRDLVSYVMGNKAAIERVNAAMSKGTTETQYYVDGMGNIRSVTFEGGKAVQALTSDLASAGIRLREDTEEVRRNSLSVNKLTEVYKGVPKRVLTEIRALGGEVTHDQLLDLSRQIKLTPKTVRIIARMNGYELTRGQIKNLTTDIQKVGKTKVDTRPLSESIGTGLDVARRKATTGVSRVGTSVKSETRKWKADLGPFTQDFSSDLTQIQSMASSGGTTAGSNMKSGLLAGFAGAAAALAAEARAAVRAAIDAANAEADSHSPSREFMKVGKNMGDGAVIGFRRSVSGLAAEAMLAVAKALKVALHRATKFHSDVSKDIVQLKNKYEQVYRKLGDTQKKALKNQLQGILKSNRAYESQWKVIEKTQQRLKSLIAEAKAYRDQVVEQIVATGNPTVDGANSFTAIIDILTRARDEAVRFSEVIAQLAKAKLNKDTIAQLVAAGPEAALASADAILQSGQNGISQINDLMEQIRNAGKDLGDTASVSLFGDRITATKAELRDLIKEIKPLSERLAKAVKQMMDKLAAEIAKGNRKIDHEVAKTGKGSSSDKGVTARKGTDTYGFDKGGSVVNNTLNYYAASGPTLSSEEALFSAGKRGRKVFAS